ncbi:Eco57I restriction-modification methylase domain-containing protein [uncultured Actinomyces sp.]|uniref:Eco57I restriction-modification methylase domain-containing protein n=1 Tax=uncultured Actinomyces sp. TaxID=249061 RepID=UPI0028DCA952|nr:hypothetical protein [uncultured Actinomyces sp.]
MDDVIVNDTEFLSAHWLAEGFPARLSALVKGWRAQAKAGGADPLHGLLSVSGDYLRAVHQALDATEGTGGAVAGGVRDDAARQTSARILAPAHDRLLGALGLLPEPGATGSEEAAAALETSHRTELVTLQGERELVVPVLLDVRGPGGHALVVLEACATDGIGDLLAEERAPGGAADQAPPGTGELVTPLSRTSASGKPEPVFTVARALSELFASDATPRYALVLAGRWALLTDAPRWSEGRYLALDLVTAMERRETTTSGGLARVAGLMSGEVLLPTPEGTTVMDSLTQDSTNHAVGVSAELRDGLRRSVEIVAGDVVRSMREAGEDEDLLDPDLPGELARQSLRFLYRLLFLLFAEAHPELGVLPTASDDYASGYGLDRLRDLCLEELPASAARTHHIHASLDVLFRLVSGDVPGVQEMPVEDLRADLFARSRTSLIDGTDGRVRHWLSDAALHRVLRLLLLSTPTGKGSRGARRRGGWISYANLGINQLGAVYEGLMSYSGVLTTQPMVEVAKGGDASKGSWLVPEADSGRYADSDIVRVTDPTTGERRIRRYGAGEFAYRLSGRDRERSASYYTPEVLTQCVVRHSLAELFTEDTTAAEVLGVRVCEPALGSGAFANEAVNQLAEAYLERRQKELGQTIDADRLPAERRRVKAWIALHRVYGVDLNATAVELAEVSMWLNVMQPHLAAPWFGLHLRRGNSLIGARRATYDLVALRKARTLHSKEVPTDQGLAAVPLGTLGTGQVHHFLLPSATWGAVADAKQAKELDSAGAKAMRTWRKTMLKRPDHRRDDVLRRDANAALVEAFLENEAADQQAASAPVAPVGSAGAGTVITEALFGGEIQQIDLAEQARMADEDRRRKAEKELRRRTVRRASQEERLIALAGRVERLWAIAARRLEVSEQEASRRIEVWGMPDALQAPPSTVTRERIEDALADPDSMYQRLRTVMNAWCALSFWPLDRRQELPDWSEWLATLEDILGLDSVQTADSERLVDQAGFDDLDLIERTERAETGMRSSVEFQVLHPWLATVQEITQKEGFFHWELDFAQVFTRGGFDLQVGNPPWVRPTWKDNETLSEADPWFMLEPKIPEKTFVARRAEVLASPRDRAAYFVDLTSMTGTSAVLGSPIEHPILAGIQTNLYMVFMERAWRSMGESGIVGLLHPEGHFVDPKAGVLREATYRRLRRHWQFRNEAQLFEEVGHTRTYGIHIYGNERTVNFLQISGVHLVQTLDASIRDDGSKEKPGIQYAMGGWDRRPHAARVVRVTAQVLSVWSVLMGSDHASVGGARLMSPLLADHQDVLELMAEHVDKIGKFGVAVSSGWHEKGAKVDGTIISETMFPSSWIDAILQGPMFFVGEPFYQLAREEVRNHSDYDPWDLEELPEFCIHRTNYRRAVSREQYDARIDHWNGEPSWNYWRVAVRRMFDVGTERSLIPALIPVGAAHVHACQRGQSPLRDDYPGGFSPRPEDALATVLMCGVWCSLPADYFVKVSGKTDLHPEFIEKLPAPLKHPAWRYLLLRTLRLNCLTRDFEPLWKALAPLTDPEDAWTPAFAGWPALAVGKRARAEAPHPADPQAGEEPITWDHAGDLGLSAWTMDTPLRSDYERRAALVETDALGAIMLGLTAEQLCLIYRAQFGVLRKYEHTMWFDSLGRQIARHHQAYGVHQDKADHPALMSYIQDMEDEGLDPATDQPPTTWYEEGPYTDFLSRYEAPFTKADREAEMTAAHAEFCRRLAAGGLTDAAGRPLGDGGQGAQKGRPGS